MKHLLLSCSLILFTLAGWAIPARRGVWRTVTLTDGSQVRVQLQGDERLHFWTSEDGTRYEAQASSDTFQVLGEAQFRQRLAVRAARKKAAALTRGSEDTRLRQAPLTGKKKCLIILVEFTDESFSLTDPQATYNSICNDRGYNQGRFSGSVKDYFSDQSNGLVEMDFDVVGPVKLSHPYSYYGQNDRNGDDLRAGQMVAEACLAADPLVDFSTYDWNGDGEADQVLVLYAGYGEASSALKNTVWPHEYYLSYSDYGKTLTLDNTTIDNYACCNELNEDGTTDGIGTICHEFSHCLGLPDLYDISGSNYGMGSWDLMDYGSYNDDGYTPPCYTAYERMTLGWLTPVEIMSDTTITGMKPINEEGAHTYIIYNKGNRNEYYLLENRQQESWDSASPGKGMLITHVDYDENVWYYNEVNTTTKTASGNNHQRCTIFHADNEAGNDISWDGSQYIYSSELGDPYPYNGNDSLNNVSTPVASVWNKNSDGSYLMNYNIHKITQNSDGTMSFGVSTKAAPVITPDEGDTIYVFRETFDLCAGAGGNDGLFSGNIGGGDLTPDNDGWDVESFPAFGAMQCARFGNSKHKITYAITPSFTLKRDTTTFTFRIAIWNNSRDKTELTLSTNNNAQLETSSFTVPKGAWATFSTHIIRNGESAVKIKFYVDGRSFLDDVMAYTTERASTNGIRTVKAAERRPAGIYSLSGVRLGTDLDRLPHGIYIVNGRKVVK